MKRGDILLIGNKFDPISWIIRKLTKSKYSHACIAITSYKLIDIKAKEIKIVPVTKYIDNKFYFCKIKIVTNISEKNIDKIIEYINHQKRQYSYLSWFISIILLFKRKKPIRNTCSGLIAEAFSKVGYYFRLDKEPYEISPQDILDRKYL